MIKIISNFALLLLLFSCSYGIEYQSSSQSEEVAHLQTAGYVFATNDIPLLSDLEIIESETTSFDTISGNISISSYYTDKISENDVRNFYIMTLPQLGFDIKKEENNNLFYKRNGNKLELSIKKDKTNESVMVKFLISSN